MKNSGRVSGTFTKRFFRSRLGTIHYFETAYKYVYRNPVEAGICLSVEQYRYSTLNGLLGFSKLWIPVEEDTILFGSGLENTLLWLNEKTSPEDKTAVKMALRKSDFSLPKASGKQHPLEYRRY
jgi:hypothetical protein